MRAGSAPARPLARLIAAAASALALAAPAVAAGVGAAPGAAAASAPRRIVNDAPWPMHPIDSRYRGANALFPADVNGDGEDDYVTNYEFDQRYVVTFRPRRAADLTRPWPSTTLYCPTADPATKGCDTESAMLADLDGDGSLDVVGAQGGHPDRVFDGDEPGVRVVWGPARSEVGDAAKWVDAGRFPATIEQGHYLWLVPRDVNGDGALDVVAGGRVYFGNGRPGGIVWLEAPRDPARRRDLTAWKLHAIDPQTAGGHGFVFADLDDDGDPDVVDANADFDTPDDQQAVHWYENPGPTSPAVVDPWRRRTLVRGPGFYGKPQIVVADMNGDGRDDLVTETIDDYLLLLRASGRRVAFRLVRVPKPELVHWASRGLRVADLDGDGRLDIVGMLTHDDATLPAGKASVYWMSHAGDRPTATGWRVHVIKWSPGRVSSTPIFGEKWDQVDLRDVDRDGDLDIVANDEEWFQEPHGELALYGTRGDDGESVAVVWFENRLHDRPWRCTERAGRCTVEGEHPARLLDGTWIERNVAPDATGGAYLQAFNAVDPASCPPAPQPPETSADCPPRADGVLLPDDTRGASYRLRLAGGRYDVWVRLRAPGRFGTALGGTRSDSVLVGLDGRAPTVVGDTGIPSDTWTWVRLASPVALRAGNHALVLRVRERGAAVDRIVLTAAGSPAPTAEA